MFLWDKKSRISHNVDGPYLFVREEELLSTVVYFQRPTTGLHFPSDLKNCINDNVQQQGIVRLHLCLLLQQILLQVPDYSEKERVPHFTVFTSIRAIASSPVLRTKDARDKDVHTAFPRLTVAVHCPPPAAPTKAEVKVTDAPTVVSL